MNCKTTAQINKENTIIEAANVLILYLERMNKQTIINNNFYIDFPLTNLIIKSGNENKCYDLFAVVNYLSKSLNEHFIAFAKNNQNGMRLILIALLKLKKRKL